MHHPLKTSGRFAVVAFATAGFLASVSHPARSSRAGFTPPQDAAKVEVKIIEKNAAKVEVRIEAAPAQVGIIEKNAAMLMLGRMVGAAQVANVDQKARQMVEQLRPILRVELRLLSSAADPSPGQRREIAMEGGRTLKEVAGNIVGLRKGLNQAGRAVPVVTDPRKLIHDSIEAASRAKLSPEQFARYRLEMERKAQDRRDVMMLNLVANLDRLLFLGDEQRARLCDSLRSNWDVWAYPSIETMAAYNAFLPVIPDHQIIPILTEEQRAVWRSTQKINFKSVRNSNTFLNGLGPNPPEDEEDADVAAALAAEEPKP